MEGIDLDEGASLLSMCLAKQVKSRRRELGMTQSVLHEMTGVGLSHISRIERGLGNPTLDMLEVLSIGLNCSVSDLVTDSLD